MRGFFFASPAFLVCAIAHAASAQCCGRTALAGRARFQHQKMSPNPITADDGAALSRKTWFLCLNEDDVRCFLWKVGEEGLYFVLEVLHPAPLLSSFQRLLQPSSFSCCRWVPLAFPPGHFTRQNY